MTSPRLFATLFVTHFLLWLIILQVNDVLGGWQVALHAEVLWFLFPAVFLPFGLSLGFGLIGVLLLGAASPAPLSSALVTGILLWGTGTVLRPRLLRHRGVYLSILAGLAQVIVVLGWSLLRWPPDVPLGTYALRIAADATVSGLIVGLGAGLWCRFHVELLSSMGWQPRLPSPAHS